MSKSTRFLARAAMAGALGMALLYLASVLPSGKLAIVCASGMLTAFIRMSCGLSWSAGCFAATALLGLFLLPQKSVALLYAVFFGYYPIVKSLIERLPSAFARWIWKLLIYNAAFAVLFLLAFSVLAGAAQVEKWPLFALIPVGNAAFVLYDIALTQVILYYLRRVAGQIK
jgi:hypothetical protein